MNFQVPLGSIFSAKDSTVYEMYAIPHPPGSSQANQFCFTGVKNKSTARRQGHRVQHANHWVNDQRSFFIVFSDLKMRT